MKKHIILALFASLISLTGNAQTKEEKKEPLTASEYIEQYRLDEAEELLNEEITKLKRRRRNADTSKQDSMLQIIRRLRPFVSATERIMVVDSFVVNKTRFLQQYQIGKHNGSIMTASSFFRQPDTMNCVVYMNDFRNKIYYPIADGKQHLRLYTSDLIGNKWSNPQPLAGLEGDSLQNFPYMMSDGVTFYYSAVNDQCIGGYDIFVTRYDIDEKKFLQPEHFGMPINSEANDYMMVIDESNQLGWFATDRRQPEDTVCIYVFIPNRIKKTYEPMLYSGEELGRLAQLTSIVETWSDRNQVEEARTRLYNVLHTKERSIVQKDFEFVINDNYTYTLLKHFKSSAAKERMKVWKENKTAHDGNKALLQYLRDQYAESNDTKRRQMSERILQMEQQCDETEQWLKQEEKEIRRLEIEFLKRQQ